DDVLAQRHGHPQGRDPLEVSGRVVELDHERVVVRRRQPESVEVGVDRAGARDVHVAVAARALDGLVEERVHVARGQGGVEEVLPSIDQVTRHDRLAVAPLLVLAQVERVGQAVRRNVVARRAYRLDVAAVRLRAEQAVERLDADRALVRVCLLRGVEAVRLGAVVRTQDLFVGRGEILGGRTPGTTRGDEHASGGERQRPTPSTYMHTRLTSQTDPAAFFPAGDRGESAPAAGLTHSLFGQ